MVDNDNVNAICSVTWRDQAKINLCEDKAPTNRNQEDELSSVADITRYIIFNNMERSPM